MLTSLPEIRAVIREETARARGLLYQQLSTDLVKTNKRDILRDTQRVSEGGENDLKNWHRRQECVMLRENEREREERKMADPVAHIQVDPTDSPSTPSLYAKMVIGPLKQGQSRVEPALQRYGVLGAIKECVRFVLARMGKYELIDFVAMLMEYAVSGEPTLRAFGGCPGGNGSPVMLALPPPHPWKLFFTGFLHRSFRRSTFLSCTSLDSRFSSFACSF